MKRCFLYLLCTNKFIVCDNELLKKNKTLYHILILNLQHHTFLKSQLMQFPYIYIFITYILFGGRINTHFPIFLINNNKLGKKQTTKLVIKKCMFVLYTFCYSNAVCNSTAPKVDLNNG